MANKGYDLQEIQRIKDECKRLGQSFVYSEKHEKDSDTAYFYFVGNHDGREVIFDAFMYPLHLEYEMIVYEMSEEKMLEKFPKFKGVEQATDEELDFLDLLMTEIEEEDEVRVSEFVSIDESNEYGVALDVCLKVEQVAVEEIEKFIQLFNSDTLELDDTEYSFSFSHDDDDE